MKPIKAQKTPDIVAQNVRLAMRSMNLSITELANILDVSRGTIYNRFLHPEEFQIGELERLAKHANKKGMRNVTAESFFRTGTATW